MIHGSHEFLHWVASDNRSEVPFTLYFAFQDFHVMIWKNTHTFSDPCTHCFLNNASAHLPDDKSKNISDKAKVLQHLW